MEFGKQRWTVTQHLATLIQDNRKTAHKICFTLNYAFIILAETCYLNYVT